MAHEIKNPLDADSAFSGTDCEELCARAANGNGSQWRWSRDENVSRR